LPGIDFSRFAGLPAAFLRPARQAEGLCSLPVAVQLAAGLAREMH
jgi:hypothetical protein